METATETKQLTPQQLALYLGCEAMYTSTRFPNFGIGKITGINTLKCEPDVTLYKDNGHGVSCNACEIKLVLRKISSLTNEESQELGVYYREELLHNIHKGYLNANQLQSLLALGIDLFNWIESGLAIDKTTLNLKHK